MPFLILAFIVIPIIELTLFIKVGALIGVLPTVAAVFISAFVGMTLIRRQGISTLLRANAKIEQGEVPANEVIEGFLLALAGALLILPGFLTDLLGLICLIPFFRQSIARYVVRKGMIPGGSSRFYYQSQRHKSDENVFEGEFSRDDEQPDVPKLKKK